MYIYTYIYTRSLRISACSPHSNAPQLLHAEIKQGQEFRLAFDSDGSHRGALTDRDGQQSQVLSAV